MGSRTPALRARQVWKATEGTGPSSRQVYDYKVEATKNLLDVQVGETLTKDQLQALINLGVDVSVSGAS